MTDILRCEWGYTGLVMTDWGTKYDPEAALHAQVDMMMPGSSAALLPLPKSAVPPHAYWH